MAIAQESTDPLRDRLVDEAARLLDDEGPEALTARRLAAAAGTSTMSIYSRFGGMPALVREIVVEGFRRLARHVNAVPPSPDPIARILELAFAYRANALANPHLYSVMFGATQLGGYRLATEDAGIGVYTFRVLADAVEEAMSAGALRGGDADAVAQQLWTAMHGFVMLEMAGMILGRADPAEAVFGPLIRAILAGHGQSD